MSQIILCSSYVVMKKLHIIILDIDLVGLS